MIIFMLLLCFYFANSLTCPAVHPILMQKQKPKPNTHKLSELSSVSGADGSPKSRLLP